MPDSPELPGITDPMVVAWLKRTDPYEQAAELVRYTPEVDGAATPVEGAVHALVGLTHPLSEVPEAHRLGVAACRIALIVEAAGVLGLEVRPREAEA